MSQRTVHPFSESQYACALRGTLPFPTNKREGIAFQALMVFAMVTCMVTFNWLLYTPSPSLTAFTQILFEYPLMFVIAMLMRTFVANPLIDAVVRRVVPKDLAGFRKTLTMTAINVITMATIMTFFGVLISHGPADFTLIAYLTSLPSAYLVAFVINLFFAGPVVKIIFTHLVKPGLPVMDKLLASMRAKALTFVPSGSGGKVD